MRVWAFPSFYPYEYPGCETTGIFAHRQYKGLISQGAELKVVVPVMWNPVFPFSLLHKEWENSRQMNYPYKRVYDGITVYHPRISNWKPSRFVKKSYTERYIDAIVNFFRTSGIRLNPKTDIFYSQWLPSSAFVQQAAHRLGVKSAILSIGDDVVVWPQSKDDHMRSFKKTLREADVRFACADYLGAEANNIVGEYLPYSVVHWGVDYDFFRPGTAGEITSTRKQYNIPGNKVAILCIGTAIERKGWLDLFDALARVQKANDNFCLVGIHAGAPAFDLTLEAQKRGLTDQFLNLGSVKPELLNKIYAAVDIFCLPSHWEGLANVVIEAMSSGLPVITTNVCGHPEIINSGINGILVPPKEPRILAEELLKLIGDEGGRKDMGKQARRFIVETWGDFRDNALLLKQKLEEAIAGNLKSIPISN